MHLYVCMYVCMYFPREAVSQAQVGIFWSAFAIAMLCYAVLYISIEHVPPVGSTAARSADAPALLDRAFKLQSSAAVGGARNSRVGCAVCAAWVWGRGRWGWRCGLDGRGEGWVDG
jgi:hypothetical protein